MAANIFSRLEGGFATRGLPLCVSAREPCPRLRGGRAVPAGRNPFARLYCVPVVQAGTQHVGSGNHWFRDVGGPEQRALMQKLLTGKNRVKASEEG